MQVGIRVKLVAMLTLVALLPLVAALAVITIGGRQLRYESVGRSIRAMASSKAAALSLSLRKDIEKLYLAVGRDTMVVSAVAAQQEKLTQAQLDDFDARWPNLSPDAQPLAGILNNPVAKYLKKIQQQDSQLTELFVTDRFGQLVAATGRTIDFYQADEAWWQGAFDQGRGRIFIPSISHDRTTGIWSMYLCIPIRNGSEVVGVAKAELDVSRWVTMEGGVLPVTAKLMLVRRDGRIIHGRGQKPLTMTAKQWEGEIASSTSTGWRITEGGEIQGFAPVLLPGQIGEEKLQAPAWSAVFYVSRGEALGDVHRLSLIVIAVGLVIIGSIFLLGLYLVEWGIVRRVRRLEHATRKVAEGHLAYRIEKMSGGPKFLGPDEIDALTDDFNRMVDRLQQSHSELEWANMLKTNFIRVAGHELRTPVSYLLATVKLLRDSMDPDRLLQAVQSMGAKAKRLDEIIQTMFKLMPDQEFTEHMNYSRVNMAELLEEIYLDSFPFIESRNQRLAVEGADKVPDFMADREKLRDIIENLVMNAIKFTPDNGVIRIKLGQELGGYVAISVKDQGPGIPDEDLPHIFDPFYSGSDVMKHSSGTSGFQKRGMGLGLTVAKHFTQLHSGTIRVSSEPGGSTFTVLIPAREVGSDEAAGPEES